MARSAGRSATPGSSEVPYDPSTVPSSATTTKRYDSDAALGYEPGELKELHRDEQMLARYFFIADPDGYKIKILERHGRYR